MRKCLLQLIYFLARAYLQCCRILGVKKGEGVDKGWWLVIVKEWGRGDRGGGG